MWRFFLHNWDGFFLGELSRMSNRKLSFGLSRNPSLVFDLPVDGNPLIGELLEAADAVASGDIETDYRLISAYRKDPYTGEWDLKMIGPVQRVTDKYTATEAVATFAVVGPFWRLDRRIADDDTGKGRTPEGLSIDGDRAQAAAEMIRWTNAEEGNTGIRALAADQDECGEIEINNWGGFRTIAQNIGDLSGGTSLNGFDWELDFSNALTSDSEGLILANWKSAPLLGEDKTGAVVFELGGNLANTEEMERTRSLEDFANKVSHVLAGASPYAEARQDNPSIISHGLWEAVADGDLLDENLRGEWVELNKVLRRRPRRLYTFTPKRSDLSSTLHRIPVPLVDYGCGDRVRARNLYGGTLRWDVAVRIYGIEIDISDNGAETVTLGLYLE